jgi:hypothetical protein
MRNRIRPRLSYANVVSSIALFVVLGGAAYATHTHKIGTKDLRKNAVTTPKIKKNAVKAAKLSKDSVRTPKIRDGVVTTPKLTDGAVDSSKLGDGAVDSSKLADDGVTLQKLDSPSVAEGFQPRSDLLYASVSGGSLVPENSRGATNATSTGTGQYTVTFERDVSGCAWFPSRSAIGTGIPANGDFLGVGGQTGQPANVRVRVRDQNNAFANRSFSLLVVC